MKKYKVTLTEEERSRLKAITFKGSHRSQKVLNALILLNCDGGEFQNLLNKLFPKMEMLFLNHTRSALYRKLT